MKRLLLLAPFLFACAGTPEPAPAPQPAPAPEVVEVVPATISELPEVRYYMVADT